jgi:hypothetical protein
MTQSRAKGARHELVTAKMFTEATGEKWIRTAQNAANGVIGDIMPEAIDSRLRALHVEVKAVAAMDLGNALWRAAIEQMLRDRPEGRVPILVWKPTRTGWAVTFWACDIWDWCSVPYSPAALRRIINRKLGLDLQPLTSKAADEVCHE